MTPLPTNVRGKFIVLEGGEGVGKTTQIEHLQRAMEMAGLHVRQEREPGGTEVGEVIRPILKSYKYPDINEWQALCGYNFSRTAFIFEVVQPALERGIWLLADRFAYSTIVYQGIAGGLPADVVQAVTAGVVGPYWPELTFVLDAPAEVGLARAALEPHHASRKDGSRYEDKGLEFHRKVRDGYLKLLADYPDRTVKMDATRPVEAVHEAIIAEINRRFGLELQPVLCAGGRVSAA